MKNKLLFLFLYSFIVSISVNAQCDFGTGLVGLNSAPFASGSAAVTVVGNDVTVTSNVNMVAGVYNFANFTVNSGVIITVTAGVGPLIIKCTGTATINGSILSEGGNGGNGTQGTFSGGIGGAGGIGAAGWGTNGGLGGSVGLGVNGNPGISFGSSSGAGLGGVGHSSSGPWSAGAGGGAGYSSNGNVGNTTDGGAGGAAGSAYGDAALSTIMTQSSVSSNLLGGSGGGGGGNRGNISRAAGGGGGGGGGAIQITATDIIFSPTGLLSVKGGNGGTSTNNGGAYGGSGGGGSGGTINLKSSNIVGFVLATNANISGGNGGASSGSNGGSAAGGNGSSGRILLEPCAPLANSITTGTISGSPFCEGSTFNVPFTSSGTFTAGNTYTAQLSDATGSFASPVNIGTLNSTANSGTISVTIPLGTLSGSGYLIRIVSSNPLITGTSSLAFTINSLVTPTFNAIANVCQNATAPILPTSSTNATPITGTWSPAVSTATPGTTVYTFTPAAGQCATTTTLSITVDANVTPTFNAVANVCQNATAPVLPTSSTNATPITGTWSPAVSTATPGTTVYTFTPAPGQCATTTTLSITVDANVTPTFNAVANVCQNASAPVLPTSSTNATPITGTWSPAVSTATPGTTVYTFTPAAGQCATTTTLSITVDANVTPTFNAVANVCQNATAPVLPTSSTNTTPITGTWSPAVSTATPGTTVYTFTPDAGQCATTATLNITVDANVTPTFSAIGPLCLNATAPVLALSSTNVPSITGTWNPAIVSTATAGLTTYTFTPDAGQCATVTTMDIEVTNSITPTFTAIGPLCLGAASPSLATSSNNLPAITGTWSPSTVNTNTVGITTYTFTPDAGQCAGVTTMDIEITNSITPSFGNIGPFCQGTTATTLPTASTNIPAITGIWLPATINTSTIGITTYTFTPDAGQCAAVTTVDIEITAPNITPTFLPIGPLCLNSVAPTLPLSSTNATPITGAWNPVTINTTTAGITTYTFTPDAGQCATVTTLDIDITSAIVPTFTGIGPLCLGAVAPGLPISSNNVPAITGTWNPATISTSSIGIVTYNFTADPNQCAANATMDIEVSNSITPTFTAITPICQGSTAPVLPNSSTNLPAITGTWNPATINSAVTGIVTYTFTPDPGQCGATTTLDVEVIAAPPAPSITITSNLTTICAGQSVDFTATPNSVNTGDVIQWFINGIAVTGGTGLLFSSNSLNNNDQVTAVFTPSSTCLAGQTATSNLILISVNPAVTPTISINATTTQICVGDNVTFNAIINGGGTNPQIQWLINGNAVAGATSSSFSTSTLANTEQVSAQLISNSPCASPNTAISNLLTMSVLPIATPTISISASSNIVCEGQQVVFNASFDFGGASPQFIWQIGSNTFTTSVPNFTALGLTSSVNISCTLISNYACTTNDTAVSNSISVQVNPIPTAVLSEDVTIQEGESTTLTATATPGMTYLWTPAASLSCSDCLSPSANPLETTAYNFVVTDPATGCSANDSVKVTVIRNYDIWVPSAFSPNGDSHNDFFFVRGNNVKEFTIKLYDRWGNLVYQSSNLAEGWNGEYKNRLINSGILVYVLDYTLNDGTTEARKGNITISN